MPLYYVTSLLDVSANPWLNVGVVKTQLDGERAMVRMGERYLDEIHNLVHDMQAPESDGLNWADVSSMNKVKTDMQEIVRFLSGNDVCPSRISLLTRELN